MTAVLPLVLLGCASTPDPVSVSFTYAGDHKQPGHVVYLDVSIENDGVRDAFVLVPATIDEARSADPAASSVGDGRPWCEHAVADISGGVAQWFVWRVVGGAKLTDRCYFQIVGKPQRVEYVVANGLTVSEQPLEHWTALREARIAGSGLVLVEARPSTTALDVPP